MILSSIAPYIWFDGRMIAQEDAKIHVLSVAAKYAATVFEGICAYRNPTISEINIFRLSEHLVRLQHSMTIMGFDQDWTSEELANVVQETTEANAIREDSHIRLSAMIVGQGLPDQTGPVALMCAVVRRGPQSLEERAVRACVSSWRRIDDTAMPPRVKCAANYNNGRLGLLEAHAKGFEEAIFLTSCGKVAEGSGACLFMVREGQLFTPRVTDGILESVTRRTLLTLCKGTLGLAALEREIDRTELYIADEVFLCGSGYEVTPVIGVDGATVGDGQIGRLTRTIWQEYEGVVRGQICVDPAWLTPVHSGRHQNEGTDAEPMGHAPQRGEPYAPAVSRSPCEGGGGDN